MKPFFRWLVCAGAAALGGCATGVPRGVQAVNGFQVERYLGTWYEIARFDHSFEKGLIRVTATYTKRDDGGIRVLNRGYDPVRKTWKQAEGRAYFVAGPGTGRLRVSFFRPFYGAYNIVDLDRANYAWALVCSSNRSYLWILSREPTLDPAVRERLVRKAAELGFDTGQLLSVPQEGEPAVQDARPAR